MPKFDIPNFDLLLNQGSMTHDKIQNIANLLREYWGLGYGPIANLSYVLEKHGIILSGADIKANKNRRLF